MTKRECKYTSLLTYPLTLVPDCIGTLDGFLAKNDKSKGFYFLTADGGEHKKTKGLLTLLSTADNKRRLFSVLLKVWGSDQFADKLKNWHVMCICEVDAFLLSSNDGKKKSQKFKNYHHYKKKPIEQ